MKNTEKKELLKEAVKKYIAGVILIGVLLFLPAGSISWRNGWILMAILFVPMFFSIFSLISRMISSRCS